MAAEHPFGVSPSDMGQFAAEALQGSRRGNPLYDILEGLEMTDRVINLLDILRDPTTHAVQHLICIAELLECVRSGADASKIWPVLFSLLRKSSLPKQIDSREAATNAGRAFQILAVFHAGIDLAIKDYMAKGRTVTTTSFFTAISKEHVLLFTWMKYLLEIVSEIGEDGRPDDEISLKYDCRSLLPGVLSRLTMACALDRTGLTINQLSARPGFYRTVVKLWANMLVDTRLDDDTTCLVSMDHICVFLRHLSRLDAEPDAVYYKQITSALKSLPDSVELCIESIPQFFRLCRAEKINAPLYILINIRIVSKYAFSSPETRKKILTSGIVPVLAETLAAASRLSPDPSSGDQDDLARYLLAVLESLKRIFEGEVNSSIWMLQALDHDLVPAIFRVLHYSSKLKRSSLPRISQMQSQLLLVSRFLLQSLTQRLNTGSLLLLRRLRSSFGKMIRQGLPDGATSTVEEIFGGMKKRIGTYSTFWKGQKKGQVLRMCENVQCDLTIAYRMMRRCGGCQYVLYCSRQCQILDWRTSHSQRCHENQRSIAIYGYPECTSRLDASWKKCLDELNIRSSRQPV